MGLELAEQFTWRLPDAVVYPTGGGLGIIAIYKAFKELQALGWVAPGSLPTLVVTQYEGCAPIVRAFAAGAEHADVWTDLDVLPGGLKSPGPPGDRAVLELLRETGGAAIAVSSAEAVAAAAKTARLEGLLPCPEAGTTVAGLEKALDRGVVERDANIVLMFTRLGTEVDVRPAGGKLSYRSRRSGTGTGLILIGNELTPAPSWGCRNGQSSWPAPTATDRYATPSVPTHRNKGD